MSRLTLALLPGTIDCYILPGKGELEYTQLRMAMREGLAFHEIQTKDGFVTVRPKEIIGAILVLEEKEQ